jgi:hypothetical protein
MRVVRMVNVGRVEVQQPASTQPVRHPNFTALHESSQVHWRMQCVRYAHVVKAIGSCTESKSMEPLLNTKPSSLLSSEIVSTLV